MNDKSLRRRLARWLDPVAPPPAPAPDPVGGRAADPWPDICERFALQMLGHAESLRPALDRLEADENDEERLQWLYQVDHSVTRMRRVARDLRILAGIEEGELGGYLSSLVDVIRAAESAIEHYPKVIIGKVVGLAVVPYASDDVSSLVAALLDNATKYSPSTVTVSAYLLESGGVMLRIEDDGIGIPPAHIEVLNAALAGPVPGVNEHTGRHTGFPVVHRLARKHGVGVRLASRSHARAGAPSGTIAMVMLPPDLLCELPDEGAALGGPVEPGSNAGFGSRPHAYPPAAWQPPSPEPEPGTIGGLPRRTRTSLRGEGGLGRRHGRPHGETAAAARSFAEDLTAFTEGERAGGQEHPEGASGDEPAR
jgi:hypothetical protein